MGAAAAALLRTGSARSGPLQLTAAKSFMGHAEPAAGVVGLTELALVLGQRGLNPILHLVSINPYVASALNSAAQHGPAFRASAPRQPAGSACAGAGALLGGVSSFAFQGTNAHAVVGVQPAAQDFSLAAASPGYQAAAALSKARFWVLPAAHLLLPSGGASRGKGFSFVCSLAAPRLALYADHVVFGRVLFPATGMLEAVLASGSALLEGPAAAGTLAVSGMAIAAPLIIAQPAPGKRSAVLRCTITPGAGAFALSHANETGASVGNASGGFDVAAATATAVAVHIPTAALLRLAAVRHLTDLQKAVSAMSGHAVGSLAPASRLHADSYHVPPACMDACIHLGVTAPGCSAKVPIAVGAFAATGKAAVYPTGSSLHGTTSAGSAAPTGTSDISSFGLATSAGGAVASLAALETKLMKAKKADGPEPMQAANFLYEVDWDAASQPYLAAGSSRRGTGASFDVINGDGAALTSASLQLSTAQGTATTALELLQSVSTRAEVVNLSAAIPNTMPAGLIRAGAGGQLLACGAFEGLLRVAASEQTSNAFTLLASDPSAAGSSGPLPMSSTKGILTSARARRGVLTLPRLLRTTATAPAAELVEVRPMPRGSLSSLVAQPSLAQSSPLQPSQVLIAVKAVGINFR